MKRMSIAGGVLTLVASASLLDAALQTRAQMPIDYKAILQTTPAQVKPGSPVTLKLKLRDPRTNAPVTRYKIEQTKPIHLIITSGDLSYFTHVHPALASDGVFTLQNFRFPHAGKYHIYGDVTPEAGGHQIKMVDVTVEGSAPSVRSLHVDRARTKRMDGYAITLKTDRTMRANEFVAVSFHIEKKGRPITDLAPWLGAAGHLVGLSADGSLYVHAHPEGALMAKYGPDITFHTLFTRPGVYKLWVEISHEGQLHTFSFVVLVKAGRRGKQAAPMHDHMDHMHGMKM